MFGEDAADRIPDVSIVHVDVLGWGDADIDRYEEVRRETELYVLGACSMGLHRREIEDDLRQRFHRSLSDLTFEIVTSRNGNVKGVVSAEALDYV